jgi:hypothetical protein
LLKGTATALHDTCRELGAAQTRGILRQGRPKHFVILEEYVLHELDCCYQGRMLNDNVAQL